MTRLPTAAASAAVLVLLALTGFPAAAQSPSPSRSPTGPSSQQASELRQRVADTPAPRPALAINGSGFGHGVGMSQYGARYLADQGWSAARILEHYYRGTAVTGRDTDRRIRVALWTNRTQLEDVITTDQPIVWKPCPDAGGPGDPVPDSACGPSAGAGEFRQPAGGTTWAVKPVDGGLDIIVNKGGPDQTGPNLPPDDPDGPDITAPRIRIERPGGTVIESTNPNRSGATLYRWGFRDIVHTTRGVRDPDTGRVSQVSVMHVVEDLEFEKYLRGLSEMPSSWADAALRSQAIAGRTYGLRVAEPAGSGGAADCSCDLVATPANQAWTAYSKETESGFGDDWVAAVDATTGRVVTYQGALAQTFYSSSHGGGVTEAIEDSWAYGTTAVPYLRSVQDPYSLRASGNSFSSWRAVVPNSQLAALAGPGIEVVTSVRVLGRTPGRTPTAVRITGRGPDGGPASTEFSGGDDKHAGAAFRLDLTPSQVTAGSRDVSWLDNLPSSQAISVAGLGPFSDDDGGFHEYAALFGYEAGIVEGLDADTYGPGRPVTRAQMASFLFRTFALSPADGSRFSDVADGDTHEEAIGAIAEAGITQGCDADTNAFCPGAPVTRAQMASFLAAAAGLPDGDGAARFSDVSADNVHAGAIGAVAEAGISEGCEDGTDRFCPHAPVTRGAMATFIHRTVQHLDN